jgi:UDP-N-acetylmuramyl tripeptide synthase
MLLLVMLCCLFAILQTTTGEMRARLGEVAHQRSDFVIVTNSSPRLEDPADIIQVRAADDEVQ